ncbi:MAG: isoamylase early set domain-containing protein [Gemmatimonadota bacterium]|nr:MAG: isoamylase early set domain-containing protein [Gemmatimonadota bacterium]
MSGKERLSPEAQGYLDGEPAGDIGPEDRQAADQFEQAVQAYAGRLQTPDASVDRAVMAAVRAEARGPRRQSVWQWLVSPHPYSVRPALVAAAAVALIVLGRLLIDIPGIEFGDRPAQLAPEAQATILVRFELRAPDADRVTLAGSFNEWSPEGVELVRNSATGMWTATVPLEPGQHEYLFVIDGSQWIPDPNAHAQVDDGFGQANSVIVVGPRGVVRS